MSLSVLIALPAAAVHASVLPASDLTSLSFEELANIQVTSVSKKAERVSDAAASIFVITHDDIRRAGATTLADALRLAPNLEVARVNAQSYAISSRGFNNSTGNKLLVLIDGRIVYTPLYSGVFWDIQDVMFEDIDRIEVISGPGSTLWGTNAVNGVINVITRTAEQSQGTSLGAYGGNRERGTAMRYGGELSNGGHYRVYGKYADHDPTATASGSAVRDSWNRTQAGFRSDWTHAQDQFTLQGDVYKADLEQSTRPGEGQGLNLLTRWIRQSSDGSSINLLAYYDRIERKFPGSYHETLDIFNFDYSHTMHTLGPHSIVWGASYRYGIDREDNSSSLAFLPAHLDQTWASFFAQDSVELKPDLTLTAGARLEHNDYTGFEFLPNIRLAWKPSADSLLWSSISRTVRSPSRIDRDFYAPAQPPYLLEGNTNFRSEIAHVYEIGYRAKPAVNFSYSATVFRSIYRYVRSLERQPSGTYILGNMMEGTATGFEAWMSYQVMESWRLSAGYSALDLRLRLQPGSTDTTGTSSAGNDPSHLWQIHSIWNIDPTRDLDIGLRHVGALPNPSVPSYTAVDIRFAWRANRQTELALTGQNLFNGRHAEFGTLSSRSEIGPSVFLQLVWRD